jgi:hypothetical protein
VTVEAGNGCGVVACQLAIPRNQRPCESAPQPSPLPGAGLMQQGLLHDIRTSAGWHQAAATQAATDRYNSTTTQPPVSKHRAASQCHAGHHNHTRG